MQYITQPQRNFFLISAIITLLFPVLVSAYQAAPVAITKEVTFVTEKSATLGGRVNANEMADTKQWFEWGFSGQSGAVYETAQYGFGGSELVNTTGSIYGLAPNTQYFYRQIAENGRGRDIGQTVYFTTKVLPLEIDPVVFVQTNDVSLLTESGVLLKGYLSPHENMTVKSWFQWGETSKFENETYHVGFGQDSGPVSIALSSLTPGTLYYYRLVAESSSGRVYGTTKVFVTLGIAPQKSEAPRAQQVPTPETGDGVTRNTTNSGIISASTQTQGGLPGANMLSSGNLPGDIFGAFFGRKKNANSTTPPSPAPIVSTNDSKINAQSQVAEVASATPLSAFWNTLTGKKDVELVIEKVGPTKIPVHTPVEYRIRYSYFLNAPASNAKLKIILPSEVVYIGDSTNNELLLEEGAGPEHTYVLPIGKLEKGSTRTVSILGMTTGDANGFPDARARIEYMGDTSGVHVVVAESGTINKSNETKSANVSASGNSFLPNSLLGWALYVLLVAGVIFASRKAKAYYEQRKEEIALEEEEAAQRAQTNTGLSTPRVA